MPQTMQHYPNLVAMFLARAHERGDGPFLQRKVDGAWQATSWAEAARTVAALATGLRAIGLQPGDRVMIVSENRPEWCLSDLAIMAAGCVTVPTYVTNTARDHQHILENSGARAVVVSTQRLAGTLVPTMLRVAPGAQLIGIDDVRSGSGLVSHRWRDLVERHPADPEAVLGGLAAGRGDLACVIYTSGTGGVPRGVCQHHGAILHNVEGTLAIVAEDFGWGDEAFLSVLPLSHAYEHSGGQYLPIGLGGQIFYAEGLEKLAGNIAEVAPTIMTVVPRLLEVLRQRILNAAEKAGGLQWRLLQRALAADARIAAGTGTIGDRMVQPLLSATVRRRVRQRFGGRLKAMVCGGAPLNPEVGAFFRALGIQIMQGYGQTEAAPVVSCNRPRAGVTVDTVGPPLKNTEVRIADDGEILVRGENVMHRYWQAPEETARALVDGWLHTGDIGEMDAMGRIRITDRKKDLIVNDKGENVSPQKVEGMLTLQPEIGQAMISGDRRPYCVALLVPDADWPGAQDEAAARAALGTAVDRVNRDLAPAERIRRFIVAGEAFTVENEQMTPSLKVRRHKVRAVYGDRIDALYR